MSWLLQKMLDAVAGPGNQKSLLRSFSPRIEKLEDRWLPSTTVSLSDNNSTVTISGDSGVNTVVIEQDDAANQIRVTYDDPSRSDPQRTSTRVFNSNTITKYDIELRGNNDSLRYVLKSATLTQAKEFEVDLGNGSDTANFDLGGTSVDGPIDPTTRLPIHRTINANLAFDIEGGDDSGADNVYFNLGAVQNSVVSIHADLDEGNDVFQANIWGNLIGRADVRIDAEGDRGDDDLAVIHRYDNATRQFAVQIDAAAALRVHLDGGRDADRVRVNCIERLFGTLDVNLEGGEGDDSGTARDGTVRGVSASIRVLPMGPLFGSAPGRLFLRLFGDQDPLLHHGNRGSDGRDRVESAVTQYYWQDFRFPWFQPSFLAYIRVVDAGSGSGNQVVNSDQMLNAYFGF